MTGHNSRLLDIYTDYLTDYLLSSFGATTTPGLSRLLPKVSHLVSALLVSRAGSVPVAFELVQKTELTTNCKTGHESGCAPPPKTSLKLEPLSPVTLSLEGVPFPVRVGCQLFKNQEGAEGTLILCSSDLSCSGAALLDIYHKRWEIEEYHKSLKSNAVLAKLPTKLPHTQQNHAFAFLVAFTKLETYRTQTHLNHFALKAKLYHSALNSAWEQLATPKQHQFPSPQPDRVR